MPEGPECRRVTEKLRVLKGQTLIEISFASNPSSLKYFNAISPYLNLLPLVCLDVICLGKQIFFFFDKNICLFGGLGMEGHWYRFFDWFSQEKYLESEPIYPKYCLNFGETSEKANWINISVWYDDKRNFGNITFGSWQDAFLKMKTLGPDLLATVYPIDDINNVLISYLPPEFFSRADLDRFKVELRKPRRVNMNICKFLMGSYITGIGNYLKSEILYAANISPYRNLGSLKDEEIKILHAVTLEKISQSYKAGGLTHGTFLDPDREKGIFEVVIYKRKDLLDPNNFLIRYDKSIDGRGTYFVPEIQI